MTHYLVRVELPACYRDLDDELSRRCFRAWPDGTPYMDGPGAIKVDVDRDATSLVDAVLGVVNDAQRGGFSGAVRVSLPNPGED